MKAVPVTSASGEHSHKFCFFFYAFSFSSYEPIQERRTDRQTDGRARPVLRRIRTAA